MRNRQELLEESERCLEEAEKCIFWVVTKGSDSLPAKNAEIEALDKHIKEKGLGEPLVGDHRLTVRAVTDGVYAWTELAKCWEYLARAV